MTVDWSEDGDAAAWAEADSAGRVMVGGHTVWTGRPPGVPIFAQPNRWGVIEDENASPDGPCRVEADPLVTGHLPLPSQVIEFVDRRHQRIPAPRASERGRRAMAAARHLAKIVEQIPAVRVAARPFARTIPLTTPLEAAELLAGLESANIVGGRLLPALAGGVALSIGPDHQPRDLVRLATVLAELVTKSPGSVRR